MLTAVRRAIADHLKPYLGLDPTAQSNPSHMQALAESTRITRPEAVGSPARCGARDGTPVVCESPSGAAPPTSWPTSAREEEAQLQVALARSEVEAAALSFSEAKARLSLRAAAVIASSADKEAFTAHRMRRKIFSAVLRRPC